jgi:hypothetical protein
VPATCLSLAATNISADCPVVSRIFRTFIFRSPST